MFMHIHGYSHSDICLPMDVQRDRSLPKALQHKWAPEKRYVTSIVRNEETLETTMELIPISHHHFLGGTKSSKPNAPARSNVIR
jgi:hypothetical protein